MTAIEPTDGKQPVLDVLILGAGFGGICAAIKLREKGIDNIRILEKAAGIGGTWWHNTYPGAACDIASHLYCYSFEPNPNWSRKYSPQPEIQAYIEHCVDKYGVRNHIRLNSAVREFRWDEVRGLWQAQLADGKIQAARHVIFASGGLHLPAFPTIPGMDRFAGPTMHSAEWDHSVDFNNRKVAVIGSAASAIQLIPELAKVAASVDVFQRTPNYIAPRNDRTFSEKEKARFARWPWLNRLYRKMIFLRGEWILFPVVKSRQPSRWRNRLEALVKAHIRGSVADPATREDLLRVHPADYLDAFKSLSDAGGGEMGRRTPFGPGGYEVAAQSAGLAKSALAAVIRGEVNNAYALSRPPGHHCLPDYPKGFCLLNNIGIAIEAAKAAGLAQRFAVLDWDVHHRNGTEAVF